ncbi:HEAT repeat domain-containing protein [Evansella sp. AB-rgal1]|uniref:HEAT repeat domain-containing protein n=1 Tax=Evansella sp. AB-rgal1 TaxID=3242696 RepID=UPI00359E5C1E
MTSIILIAILFLLIVQCSIMVYLLVSKIKRNRIVRKKEELKEKLIPLVDQFVQEKRDNNMIVTTNEVELEVLEEILNEYALLVNLETSLARINDFAEFTLKNKYQRLLQSNKWSSRMNALYFIEDFNMKSLSDLVYEPLNKEGAIILDEEMKQRFRTLATLQDERIVKDVFRISNGASSFYKEIFRKYNELLFQLQTEMITNQSTVSALSGLLGVIGEKRDFAYYPFVEKLLLHEDSELRVQALKAILQYEYMSDPDKLTQFLMSPHWPERMIATKIVGNLRLNRFKKSLIDLVKNDAEWWVQFSASEAISKFEDGEFILGHMRESLPRSKAAIVDQWVEKGEIGNA